MILYLDSAQFSNNFPEQLFFPQNLLFVAQPYTKTPSPYTTRTNTNPEHYCQRKTSGIVSWIKLSES